MTKRDEPHAQSHYLASLPVRPGLCSHVWRDARYFGQLVFNRDVAPWDMKKGQTYICVNCRMRLYP